MEYGDNKGYKVQVVQDTRENLFFSDNREQKTHIQRIPQLHQCDVC